MSHGSPAIDVTPLQLASCMINGVDPAVPPLPAAPAGLTSRAALENVVREALLRPPCVVSFSGGRDSSAMLALATHVARRDGLPLPVPVSLRFPDAAESVEDDWQQLLVGHLELPDWIRTTFTDELDVVGPHAQRVLGRFGVLWPFNAHFHLPIAEHAAGGTVLTGFGGDELLASGWVWHRLNVARYRRRRWQPRDLAHLALAGAPLPVRRAVLQRRFGSHYTLPWLRPRAQRAFRREAVLDLAREPVRYDASIDRAWWRTRYRRTAEDSLARVASLHDARIRHPLADPMVLAAFAREVGPATFPHRTAGMQHLFGDLLPAELTARHTKALLTGAFWNAHARRFVASWTGAGLDPTIVDVDALARIWRDPAGRPDARTFGLLQSAWLAAHPAGAAPEPGVPASTPRRS